MKKEISQEEKFDFYKKFINEDFQAKYSKIPDMPAKVSISSISIFAPFGGIFAIFNPWFALLMIPALAIPFGCFKYCRFKQNKAIKSLNPNMSVTEIKRMTDNGEWTSLRFEYTKQKMLEEHQKTMESLNISKQSKTNSHKKQNKDIKLTYNLLAKFCDQFNYTLVEFKPSINYETTHEYYVRVRTHSGMLNFKVTGKYFVCNNRNNPINLTAQWKEYLSSRQELSL